MSNYKHQRKHFGIPGVPLELVSLVRRKTKNRKSRKKKEQS